MCKEFVATSSKEKTFVIRMALYSSIEDMPLMIHLGMAPVYIYVVHNYVVSSEENQVLNILRISAVLMTCGEC